MSDAIVEVKHLKKYFQVKNGLLHAVDNVNFVIPKGTTMGLVGESGCGKSTIGRLILRLTEATEGEILFEGQDIRKLNKKDMRQMRQKIQMVFQDPYASLDGRKSVFESIAEPLIVQKVYTQKADLEKRVYELMETAGLAKRLVNSYPHELDGGRRQRIGIARALALKPKFIVCDEPVSALDVSIQAQILNLMQDLQDELDLTYMFITHDLSVVKHFSNQIMVMYLGQMVEMAPTEMLFKNPVHPYTKALLSAIPIPDPDYPMERIMMKGEITSPIDPEPGCRFAKRCPYATEVCGSPDIHLTEVEPGHFVSCMRIGEFDK